MLTAKLLRLDIPWSATPQLRRRPACLTSRQVAAVGRSRAADAACPLRPVSSSIVPRSRPQNLAGLASRPATGLASRLSISILCDPGLGCAEMSACLPPQHLVEDSGREQFTDPPEPHEPRRQEILMGQAVLGVGADELVDSVADTPAQPEARESPG